MQIVNPVIVEPLMVEWANVKAEITAILDKAPKETKEKLLRGTELAARTKAMNEAEMKRKDFIERLLAFRVLDPACGSGNFLYLALLELKNIEHRVNLEAEALGFARQFPRMGPEAVIGIELNPYAAELARISVWIGEIQWMRKNGFEAAKNPILRTLDTIQCRDAVLTADGKRAAWPRADVVVGNPPFLGNKKMIRELGEEYSVALRKAYADVSGGADLVTYWFAKTWAQIQAGELTRAGLVATNSIRGGANREVLKSIVEGGRIFEAWSDEEWTVEGAAVRVSLICFDRTKESEVRLNGLKVDEVYSDLTGGPMGTDLTTAIKLFENAGVGFQGPNAVGPFDIHGKPARAFLLEPTNPNGRSNSDVVHPWRNASDLVQVSRDMWIIDFGLDIKEADAALFQGPFDYVVSTVYPARKNMKSAKGVAPWLHQRPRPVLRGALNGLQKYIASPQTSKYRVFVWLDAKIVSDVTLIVFARDDDTTFGILHSRFHELWALRMGTSLEDRPRYTPSTTFETFPFPEGLTPNIPAASYADDPRAIKIAGAAARLNELRENWLNPPDLIMRVPEVVPGYPDRILPVSPEAGAVLKKRTLTNLYNARPAWLAHAHDALDEAVAEAYGWGDDWRAGLLTEDEILARLFALNQQRSKGEKSRKAS